ncbi:hypothetical protein [Streptoalloteichus tenebrarius]|uniref:hypothetical protein n=1 Tax=Streptoalloteichus tenebrarius (strain ATCC 17920 / DSM 40477 / JCM 4838 / CBS 697.72 / NBRC 16177 / NCIMB 11028 / NRRL B-12390 / A12253. 1 / ISP 5477) TaxID=1933 RepID=UPI0020A39792|nr:hypothetical protein [Streptoalloteichus tenebrarius]
MTGRRRAVRRQVPGLARERGGDGRSGERGTVPRGERGGVRSDRDARAGLRITAWLGDGAPTVR